MEAKAEMEALVAPLVGHRELPDFEILVQRHEVAGVGLDAGIFRADGGVAHAVAAGVVLELVAGGLPGGGPELLGFIVAQVDVASAEVEGRVVVAVAGEPAQAGIAIERVASRGVGDNAEISLATKVVDPGQGGIGLSNHVLALHIVEKSVLHGGCSLCRMVPSV